MQAGVNALFVNALIKSLCLCAKGENLFQTANLITAPNGVDLLWKHAVNN